MTKEETLAAMENVKHNHERLMFDIGNLVKGRGLQEPVPLSKHQCSFGEWLYGSKNHVKEILGEQFYDNIETIHSEWHVNYFKIHKIFFNEKKKGFFSSLMGTDKATDMELDKAKLYYSELEQTTKSLLAALATSQRRVHAMNENRFH